MKGIAIAAAFLWLAAGHPGWERGDWFFVVWGVILLVVYCRGHKHEEE